MKLELLYNQKYTTMEDVALERESTLTAYHLCHRPRLPFGHILIERSCGIIHCKRGCNKEKKRPTHHKQQQKSTVSNTQKQKEQNVWEVWSDETRVVVYSKDTTAEGVATERGRESWLTALHSCHCTRIPFGQVRVKCAKRARCWWSATKDPIHIGHFRHVPVLNWTVRRNHRTFWCPPSNPIGHRSS